jgi:hypothetical protein
VLPPCWRHHGCSPCVPVPNALWKSKIHFKSDDGNTRCEELVVDGGFRVGAYVATRLESDGHLWQDLISRPIFWRVQDFPLESSSGEPELHIPSR